MGGSEVPKKANGPHGLSSGFTLVELLVVIAIISVLATLLLLQLGVARAKARDTKRIADINQVTSAVELYFDDNGFYFANTTMTSLAPSYLVRIPIDPLATGCADNIYDGAAGGAAQCYGYEWNPLANPTRYHVWAELEKYNRNALTADADINSTGWTGTGAEAIGANDVSTGCTIAVNDCIFDLGQN